MLCFTDLLPAAFGWPRELASLCCEVLASLSSIPGITDRLIVAAGSAPESLDLLLIAIAALSIAGFDRATVVRLQRFLKQHAAVAWVLAASFAATALMWNAAREQTRRNELAQFEHSVEELRRSVVLRVERYEEALVTIRTALQTLGPGQVEEWDKFSRALRGKDLPSGFQFIGVFEMSSGEGRRESDPSLASAPSGSVWKVSRIVDSEGHRLALAERSKELDPWFASSNALLQAADRARRTGRLGIGSTARRPANTVVTLGREGKGFFLALPLPDSPAVDAGTDPSSSQDPLSVRSYLVAFVDAAGIIEAMGGVGLSAADCQLFSGPRPHPSSLLGASATPPGPFAETASASLERTAAIRVGGQDWALSCRFLGSDVPLYRKLDFQVLFGGLATTALLFTIALRIDRRRARSERHAKGLTRRLAERKARLSLQRSEREAALRSSEERYLLAARAALDGLWDWNLQTNEIEFSPRWKAMLGFGEEELTNNPEEWLSRVHPDDRDRFQTRLSEHLEGRTARFEIEHRVLHRDGGYRWMLCRGLAVRDEERKARRIAGSQTDMTSRRTAEKRLHHAALHDPLTGLPNRGSFMEQLATAVQNAKRRDNYLFALLFLDVDRFKVVNDSLGHLVGDELLVSISERLKACLRPTDTIARLGGDEFAILLDRLSKVTEATCIADRIQESFSRPFKVAGQEIFSAVSIGITFGCAGHDRAEDLLRNADTAMYRAKAHGKARYELFEQGMRAHGIERLQMENTLRRGLENREFVIYYQPIVSLASGQITGCEALVRWQHPERGLLLPDEFIPVAEETGHIIPLSEWLTLTACSQVSAWMQAGLPPLQLSINVSPCQFKQQNISEMVNQALVRSGLNPGLLQLELTESALVDDDEATVKPLVELYDEGVRISLDDFGTGYSSLVYLRRFPISVLKISESFIRHVVTSPGDAAIASGLIALAHGLDLTVVVEGVETPEQLAFLQAKKCEAVQGHVVSPALKASDFVRFVKQWRGLSVAV